MRPFSIRPLLVIAVIAVAALAVVQFATARTDRQQATTVKVRGGEFFFKLSTKSLAKPGKVTFAFKNIGHVAHNFHIGGRGTRLLQPSRTQNLVVTFKKKGKYRYLCTVPGHAAAGMKGTFTVR